MATHRFAPVVFHPTMGVHDAVLRVQDSDVVTTETLDAHGFDQNLVKRGSDQNPMTGPFHVEGAEAGDVLSVEILDISMTRKTGWTRSGLAWNVVDPAMVKLMPPRDKIIWDIGDNGIALQEPTPGLSHWTVPLDPMIGCFGVAPSGGEALSTATSGAHGGNMDYRMFKPGTTAYFPVAVPGALFFLGDVHACQGDGEIAGTGIETSADVSFRVRIIKSKLITWPRGETADAIFTVGNARPLEQALQHATSEMLAWLEQDYGLDKVSASHLLGMAVRYDIANVFNPAFSVACRIGKNWLPKTIMK
jgi:amidase